MRLIGLAVIVAVGLILAPLAAEALGLTIPQSLVVRADEIIH